MSWTLTASDGASGHHNPIARRERDRLARLAAGRAEKYRAEGVFAVMRFHAAGGSG